MIALSHDGRYLLYEFGTPSASEGGGWWVHRRDLTTGEDVRVGMNQYSFPVMSSDGRFVAATGMGLWDAEVGAVVSGAGAYPSLSDDGTLLAYYDGGPHVINRVTGAEMPVPASPSGDASNPVRLSGDGLIGTTGEHSGRGLVQFDVATGKVLCSQPLPPLPVPLVVSRTGRYVVGIAGGRLDLGQVGYFWADMKTGRYEVIPRSADGACGGPFEHSIDVGDDGDWVVFGTHGGYGTDLGPTSDGFFDAFGYYRVDITDDGLSVSSASGYVTTADRGGNNCSTVAASGDGSLVVFASELPPISSPANSTTSSTGPDYPITESSTTSVISPSDTSVDSTLDVSAARTDTRIGSRQVRASESTNGSRIYIAVGRTGKPVILSPISVPASNGGGSTTTTVTSTTVTATTTVTSTIATTPIGKPTVPRLGGFTPQKVALVSGIKVPAGSRVSMVVLTSSKRYCAMKKGKLVALRTGSCRVRVTVTPKKGKSTSRVVALRTK